MTATDTQEFTSLLTSLRDAAAQSSLSSLQQRAWERFEQLGLPERRSEAFRYIRLSKLYDNLFAPLEAGKTADKSSDPFTLTLVNNQLQGEMSQQLKDSGLVVLPLQEAVAKYGTFLNNRWQQLGQEPDPFASLNGALCRDGLFIYVPANTCVENPVTVRMLERHGSSQLSLPRIHLYAARGSQLELVVDSSLDSDHPSWTNSLLDAVLDENSRVTITDLGGQEADSSWLFHALRAQLKRDSNLTVTGLCQGSHSTRSSARVDLVGENAEVSLNALWILRNKREAHAHVHIEHHAPNCRSNQLFKSVLLDQARSSFEGKIYVHPEAQKTDAFQLNSNLLLGERAQANSKPNLEIFADDVKASHGSTVGQLSQDELFYLMSRGYSRPQAESLLVRAFCEQVIEAVDTPATQQLFAARVEASLS